MPAPRDPATGRQTTACTDETVAAICARLEDGADPCTLAEALRAARVHRSTYYDWQRRAAAGEQPYADAVAAIEDARQALKVDLLRRIRKLAKSGTREDGTKLNALKWQAEKLFREDFDPPKQLELSGPGGGALRTEVVAKVVVLPPLEPDDAGDAGARGSDLAPEPGAADALPRESR